MGQHPVNVLLGQMIEAGALGEDTAQKRMNVFDSGFLVRGGGIAVEDPRYRSGIAHTFQSDRVGKLGTVVSEDDREQAGEQTGAQVLPEGLKDINNGLGGIPLPDESKQQVTVGKNECQQDFSSRGSND